MSVSSTLLVKNVGTAFAKRRLSPDAIECALAVNHLGPFLLTNLLLHLLKASAPARIVNVGTRIKPYEKFAEMIDAHWDPKSERG